MAKRSKRQVRYSRPLAERICERLAQGERWVDMSKEDRMPGYVTFYTWIEARPEFAAMVAAARRMAADLFLDQALKVAEATSKETAIADRLKVDTLMKRAAQATGGAGREDRKAAAAQARPVKVTFYARHFERYLDADGRWAVREVTPISRLPITEADGVDEQRLLAEQEAGNASGRDLGPDVVKRGTN